MSAIGGFCHWDGRPVSGTRLAVLAKHHRRAGTEAAGTVQPHPWLALQANVLHFDHLSTHERQPYTFGRGSVLTWDGRLDNRDDLLLTLHRDLDADKTDAALVAAAYERWGLEALPRLIGDWALAIWDATQQRIVLARDYMGNRPLYYRATANGLAWATSLEALAASEGLFGEPDDGYLGGYLTIGTAPDTTPFAGVKSLLAGHTLLSTHQGTEVARYWHFTPITLRYRDIGQYDEQLRHLLTEAVRVRMRSRRAVWAHLSGGWDSSSVVCIAQRLLGRQDVEAPAIRPLSMVFNDPEAADELPFITAVEQWCGLKTLAFPFPPRPTFADMLGHREVAPLGYGWGMNEPVKQAGDHVVLTGILGDSYGGRGGRLALPLIEPLHESSLMERLRAVVAHARARRTSLVSAVSMTLWQKVAPQRGPWQGIPRDEYRCDMPREPLIGATQAARDKARSHRPIFRPALDAFPRTRQDVVDQLYRVAIAGVTSSGDLPLEVWQTHPYTHRPLVQFLIAIPHLALEEPLVMRGGMRRALFDVLPPELKAQQRKRGIVPAAVERSRRRLGEALAQSVPLTEPVAQWLLVQRDVVDPNVLGEAVRVTRHGGMPSEFLDRCVRLEAWLRTLSVASSENAVDEEPPASPAVAGFRRSTVPSEVGS